MNIIHLKYAIVIAETGSMSKAAEKLYVAQPNLSRAIKELESELNITIFDRNSKGIVITPEGEKLIIYGKKILKQINDLEKSFSDNGQKKVFSISVPRSSYISSAFTEFSKTLANIDNVEFIYKETNAYKVINDIINNDFKLGIIRYDINYDHYFKDMLEKKDLSYELIHEFNYVLIFNRNSPLAELNDITLEDLRNYIEISHKDVFIPQIPISEVARMETANERGRRIYVFERASEFEILSENEEAFMWVSPIPQKTLDRYNLVQRQCADHTRTYKDLLLYKSSHKLTSLEKDFITYLCESKRKVRIQK